MTAGLGARAALVILVMVVALALPGLGCDEPCCTVDSRAHPARPGRPAASCWSRFRRAQGPAPGLLDTGSPGHVLAQRRARRPAPGSSERDVTLLGPPAALQPGAGAGACCADLLTVEAPLGQVGTGAEPLAPAGRAGRRRADRLLGRARLRRPEMTLWRRQAGQRRLPRRRSATRSCSCPAGAAASCWRSTRATGWAAASRTSSAPRACWCGPAPPRRVRCAPTRCPTRCCPGEERRLTTGTDLSLLLATGVGPVVLGRAAWERVRAHCPRGPSRRCRTGHCCTLPYAARPVPALSPSCPGWRWSTARPTSPTIPAPAASWPAPAGWSRWPVAEPERPARAACALPCDRDPRRTRAGPRTPPPTSSWPATLEVAVIEDTTPFLQAIRMEVRPRGPRWTGCWARRRWPAPGSSWTTCPRRPGPSSPANPRWTAPDAGRTPAAGPPVRSGNCRSRWAAVPRLPGRASSALCFGLPAHGLPEMCEDATRARSDRLIGCRLRAAPPGVAPSRGCPCAGAAAQPRDGAPPPPAPAQPPPTRPRIAITELTLEGEGAAPALAMQLQDGFVLGWSAAASTSSTRPTSPSGWPARPSCRAARPRPASSAWAICWASRSSSG